MNKDKKAIGKLYDETQHTEFRMCHFLNKNRPMFLIDLGYCFEMEASTQYNKNDIILVQYPPDRNEKKRIIRIEYEYGLKQVKWDLEFPRNNWKALNLVTRKKYGENFPLFIKSSKTYNSFFAVDCRNKFVQQFDIEKLPYNLDFETDDLFYRIYWHEVAQHQYIDDKKTKKLVNGNICLIEFNLWETFYHFLWQRFLIG